MNMEQFLKEAESLSLVYDDHAKHIAAYSKELEG